MDKLDEGRSRLIKSGGFFDEEFIIRLYMEMLVFMSCFGKTGGFRTLLLERRDCLATTRLMSLHVGKGQTAGDAVKRALGYIKDPTKTEWYIGDELWLYTADGRSGVHADAAGVSDNHGEKTR